MAVTATALLTCGCGADAPGDSSASAGSSTVSAPPTTTGSESSSAGTTETPAAEPLTSSELQALGWRGVQAPTPQNVEVIPAGVAIGDGPPLPRPTLRASLLPGQVLTQGSTTFARAEVYGRVAPSWSDPADRWPDPPGSTRWYTFSLYLPPSFPTATEDSEWLDLTQWKGVEGGSPPLAIEVHGSDLALGGTRGDAGLVPGHGDLGPLPIGHWTTLVVGIHFSPGQDGWVEVSRDGSPVIPRTSLSTMDVIDGAVDPVYLKQGIYRSHAWDVRQVAYFSPVSVAESSPAA